MLSSRNATEGDPPSSEDEDEDEESAETRAMIMRPEAEAVSEIDEERKGRIRFNDFLQWDKQHYGRRVLVQRHITKQQYKVGREAILKRELSRGGSAAGGGEKQLLRGGSCRRNNCVGRDGGTEGGSCVGFVE